MKTVLMALVAMLLAAGCGGGGGPADGGGGGNPTGPDAVAAVIVAPSEIALNVGDSRQMEVTLRNAQGHVLHGRQITWSSGDASKITVTSSGLVRAMGAGTTTVMASAEGRNATARIVVTVPDPVVHRVELDTIAQDIEEGSSRQFSAIAYDADNNVVTGRGIRWSSSDPGSVSVEADGRATALRTGTVSITATIDGRSASATIRVFANHGFDLAFGSAEVAAPDELFTLDLNDPQALATPLFPMGRPASHVAPSPDGSRIAFVVYAESGGSAWPATVFVADRDGGNPLRLTWNDARNSSPAWSPDGRQIAFSSQVLGEPADVWVMDIDGSNAVNLTADQPGASKRSPAWSPHLGDGGYRIAYSCEAGGSSQLWTMRVDGTDKRLITGDASFFDSDPAWSPDGLTIAFQRSGAATFGDLYLVSATGGPARALMTGNALANGQFAPAWSPDGRLIAFASRHEDGEHDQIYTVWSDGTRIARRTTGPRIHSDPAWIMKRE